MRTIGRVPLLAVCAVLVAGCATQVPYDPANQSTDVQLPPDRFERLGPVAGKSCRAVVLKVFAMSSPTVYEAELEARRQVPSLDLVFEKNIYGESETLVPVIYGKRCIYIEGIAIRIRQADRS